MRFGIVADNHQVGQREGKGWCEGRNSSAHGEFYQELMVFKNYETESVQIQDDSKSRKGTGIKEPERAMVEGTFEHYCLNDERLIEPEMTRTILDSRPTHRCPVVKVGSLLFLQ